MTTATTMRDPCPKCAAEPVAHPFVVQEIVHRSGNETRITSTDKFDCGTVVFDDGSVSESEKCLRNQLDEWRRSMVLVKEQWMNAENRIKKLLSERMDRAEAKIGTRPAHVVVGELECKYMALVEACENLRTVEQS